MIQDQDKNNEINKPADSTPPPPSTTPIDADETVHELPDREPVVPADPDDLVHTFPPETEIKNTDDIDDLIHPPAIDADETEGN